VLKQFTAVKRDKRQASPGMLTAKGPEPKRAMVEDSEEGGMVLILMYGGGCQWRQSTCQWRLSSRRRTRMLMRRYGGVGGRAHGV
jgi:hypothetical protein